MNNTIGPGNTIAHNTQDGVLVDGGNYTSQGNRITGNSIHSNGGKGIDLRNNGNAELSAPAINSASCGHASGTVACTSGTVEVFSDKADEGRVYHGSATVDPAWLAYVFSGTVFGPNVTATVTDNQNNTSEFSAPTLEACYRVCLPLVVK